jgi:hypothetical protein
MGIDGLIRGKLLTLERSKGSKRSDTVIPGRPPGRLDRGFTVFVANKWLPARQGLATNGEIMSRRAGIAAASR